MGNKQTIFDSRNLFLSTCYWVKEESENHGLKNSPPSSIKDYRPNGQCPFSAFRGNVISQTTAELLSPLSLSLLHRCLPFSCYAKCYCNHGYKSCMWTTEESPKSWLQWCWFKLQWHLPLRAMKEWHYSTVLSYTVLCNHQCFFDQISKIKNVAKWVCTSMTQCPHSTIYS